MRGRLSALFRGLFICAILSARALAQTPDLLQAPPAPPSAPDPIELTERYCNSLLPGDAHAEPLHRACLFALTLRERLPNFQCDMKLVKYAKAFGSARMRYSQPVMAEIQKVTARARYVDGRDYYDELRVGGKPVADSQTLLQGLWSSGEFGVRLSAAFAPQLVPDLAFVRETKISGHDALEYSFVVSTENNTLWLWVSPVGIAHPGYAGRIWIGKSDGNILQLQMKSAGGVPAGYSMRSEATQTEFAYADFKDGTGFLLPSHVQLDTEMTGGVAFRHVISFANCGKFRGTARIVTEP